MAYYQGDYYRGDYYRGDPFAFPLVGALGRVAAKVIPGIAKKAVSVVGGLLKKPSTAVAIGTTAASAAVGARVEAARKPVTTSMPPSVAARIPRAGIKGTIQRLLPGGETGYYKRRRMNVTNSKALRRAIRRATGFAKLARRVLSFVDARAPKARAKFKTRGRR